jgi:hypothetical protein
MPILTNASLPGSTVSGSIGNQIGQAVNSSLLGSVGLSQASTRVNVAQQYAYSNKSLVPMPKFVYPDANTDWRVRLSLPPNSPYFYNDSSNALLKPLMTEISGSGGGGDNAITSLFGGSAGSGAKRIGVVFPYLPQVQVTHTANYEAQKLTHNNYAQYFYQNSEVGAITIAGDFTVQNINEGQYLLAVVYFFRSVTKMFFGMDQDAGQPPPILYLNGYGQYYLPNVPVVVTSFQHTMPADVDYMDIPEPGLMGYNPQLSNARLNSTRLPTNSTVTLTVQPVYSRVAQSQSFSLRDFSNGALINPVGIGQPASAFGASHAATNVKTPPVGGFL